MTNALGPGTCNVPMNMPVEERAIWGQIACSEGKSLNGYFAELRLEWAKRNRPEVAVKIEDIRRKRREQLRLAAGIVLLASGLLMVAGELRGASKHLAREGSFRVLTARAKKRSEDGEV